MGGTMIFWFSGSGNTYDIARQISDFAGGRMVQIKKGMDTPDLAGYEKIGFAFPVYYGALPRMVHTFISETAWPGDNYYFAAATMGMVGSGALTVLDGILKGKGAGLSYGVALRMPRNYILEYNPLNQEKAAKTIARADAGLKEAMEEIAAGRTNNMRKMKLVSKKLYKDIESLDRDFYAGESCISCGLCQKVCPASNIEILEGRPVWRRHCEHCMACIHWCPQKAIEYGVKTRKRRRYHHPRVSAGDLTGI